MLTKYSTIDFDGIILSNRNIDRIRQNGPCKV